MGTLRYKEGDYNNAMKYYTKAIELGDVDSYCRLAACLQIGENSTLSDEEDIERDEEKEVYHWEEAAIAGHPHGRFSLALYEMKNMRIDRALKHFIIAANLGHDASLQRIKEMYMYGALEKEDFAEALRAHQAAVDATKSPQREAAEKFYAERSRSRGGNENSL
mmetsp:Transcript_4854/g.7094  ORF Transcript_4854/g.7094 Transcript_4854/m.7094 type:complete len:164 (+) Transcript_4854:189-680(+)